MNFGNQIAGDWLKHAYAACNRYRDSKLSALLVTQLVLIFVAEPLALEGFAFPLIASGIIATGLILLLVVGSHQHGGLIVIGLFGVRLLSACVALFWGTSLTEAAEAISAVLALLATIWAISVIVFGPGRITAHRVRGAVVLYLSIAIIFAWLYRLVAQEVPGAFSGLMFRADQFGALSPFLYYSLTSLTTVGFGDIAPVDAFARNLTMFEALVGQLFPTIILARILTLYAADRSRPTQTRETIVVSQENIELGS